MEPTIRDILDPVCGRAASRLGSAFSRARASWQVPFSDGGRLGLRRQPQRRESSEEPLSEPLGHIGRQ